MTGFAPHSFAPRVELHLAPVISIAVDAYRRMRLFVDLSEDEIGWLGTVTRHGYEFRIEEVFLCKQAVHATTTELSPDGQVELVMELMANGYDANVINALRFWGHSHVRMGTSPSFQDEDEFSKLADGCPWFIRGIANKFGRLEFTLSLTEEGITVTDVPWEVYEPVATELRDEVAAEIAAKVTKKTYTSSSPGNGGAKPKVKPPSRGRKRKSNAS